MSATQLRNALIIVGFAFICGRSASAGAVHNLFTKTLCPLYANRDDSSAIGSATPGTPFTVDAASATFHGRRRLILRGWSPKVATSVLYEAPDLRIVLAKFLTGNNVERTILRQKTDAYGMVWQQLSISVWVPTTMIVNNVSVVWDRAQKLYDSRCGSCHALHEPSDFTANEWPGILDAMAKNAAFDPAQTALVIKYLQTHARPN